MASSTSKKSDPNVTALSTDPKDYVYGPTGSMTSRTQGGTTQDGGVRVVGDDTKPEKQQAAYAGLGVDLGQGG